MASDVFAMYQSLVNDAVIEEELLWKNTPVDKVGDYDYLLEVIDWDANVNPNFAKDHFMAPRPVRPEAEMNDQGYSGQWIVY